LLASANLYLGVRNLPESLTAQVREERRKLELSRKSQSSLGILAIVFSTPSLFLLLTMFAILSLGFSNMESTLGLFGIARGIFPTPKEASIVFLVVGITAIITQGAILRPLSRKYSESYLLSAGLIAMVIGFIGISISYDIWLLGLVAIPIAFGSSIANPSSAALLSKIAPKENSGEVLGLNQSLAALARIFGPLMGSALFESFGVEYPYYAGAMLLFVSFLLSLVLIYLVRSQSLKMTTRYCYNCGFQLRQAVANCSSCGVVILDESMAM